MKRCFLIIALLGLVFSCQIEEQDTPLPIDNFIKFYGEMSVSYTLADIGVHYNESGAVEAYFLLGTSFRENDSNLYIIKTNPEGSIVSDTTLSFGTSALDVARRLHIAGDSVFVLGHTTFRSNSNNLLNGIIWTCLNANNLMPVIDFPSGHVLDTILIDTTSAGLSIRGNDILKTSDENVVIVGNFDQNPEDQQHFRLKLDVFNPDNLLWFRPNGVGTDDDLVRAFEEDDGSMVFIGNTQSPGSKRGEGGLNVTWIRTNSDGIPIDGKSHGVAIGNNINSNEYVADAIQKPGGYVVTGTSSGTFNEFAFTMNLSSNGDLLSGDTLTSLFKSRTISTRSINSRGLAITRGINSDLFIVGVYPDFRPSSLSNDINRGHEAMFIRVDQGGKPIEGFETHYGLENGDDMASAALTLPNGKILVGATIDFGSGITLMSLIKLNDTGLLDE